MTNFYLCSSIVLKRVRLGDLCLRALGRTAFARACLVLLHAFGKKMGFGMLWPLTTANFKIYPAGARNFIPSLQHTTTIHHLFGLLCDQSVTRGASGKMLVLFGYRFGVSFCAGSIFASHMRARLNQYIVRRGVPKLG